MSKEIPLDVKSAEEHLMRFLAVEGVTGQEKAIAEAVSDELKKIGVPASAIRFDTANKRIPLPTQTGNLIVELPGTRPGPAPAVRHAPRYSAVVCRREAEARGRPHRFRRQDGLGRRQSHRLRRAGLAGRDASQAQIAAPADHAALHRARGERVARSS